MQEAASTSASDHPRPRTWTVAIVLYRIRIYTPACTCSAMRIIAQWSDPDTCMYSSSGRMLVQQPLSVK